MKKTSTKRSRRRRSSPPAVSSLVVINSDVAGIDIGATQHYVAVPEDRDAEPVRAFDTFTADLHRIADWLEQCGVRSVAMESTGVYWIPLFELLERRGFEVLLVNARHVKNVPGRKSDVLDCQWLRTLHACGLLAGAFRPAEQICVLRAYLRQRAMLVECAATHIQHMQKALQQMNLLLHNVIADITGSSGQRIIRAILDGQRDPMQLAALRDHRCKNPVEVIAKSLEGTYRDEHLFALRQAVELFDVYRAKVAACDTAIERALADFDQVDDGEPPPSRRATKKPSAGAPGFDARGLLFRATGVDLTQIDGIAETTALVVLAEIGTDMSRWKSDKQFASWLGLCPGTQITGGKRLSGRSKKTANRAAAALRMAAVSLRSSKSALGAYLRRKAAQLGMPKAITATAHKLARIIYALLKHGSAYVDMGQQAYEQQYQQRQLQNLMSRARALGYHLVPHAPDPVVP